jgi:competence protein ComEC
MQGRNEALKSFAQRQFSAQQSRFFLWAPVMMMLGIAGYFLINTEPPYYRGAQGLLASLSLLWLLRRRTVRIAAWAGFFIMLGFAAAQFRAQSLQGPLLAEELRYRQVEGVVQSVESVDKKIKIVLSQPVIEKLPAAETPRAIRVSQREGEVKPQLGDRIHLKATLYPLSLPTRPGGYDFARHFYFQGIGGSGYGISPLEIVEHKKEQGLAADMANLRRRLADAMRSGMPGATGAVAAALTVGEAGPIAESVKEDLRDSGLYHILSISGLHLTIVTGIVFFNLRLLLSLFPALALRFSIKKLSALLALAAAFFYLALAGYPIPAQRSFIMVAFVLAAILFDRQGITLRTLALAAVFILLCFPEALMGASFQMSFAATLAIVSLYERFGHVLSRPQRRWWMRLWVYMAGIMATSLAASLATAPFVLYHFNRFALLGILSNLASLPLASFVIMPGIVLSLLLMPFGLESLGYVPLALGIDAMLAVSQWVAMFPGAALQFPSLTDAGLALAASGLLLLCLVAGHIRLLGVAGVALGVATIAQHMPADVLVSEDARQVMVRLPDGEFTTLKGTSRAYSVEDWLQSEGKEALVPLKETGIECDKETCTYKRHGHTLIMVKKAEGDAILDTVCQRQPEVMIAWRYLNARRCPGPAILIGRRELETHGPHALWLEPEGIRLKRTREPGEGRLWQPIMRRPYQSGGEEREN